MADGWNLAERFFFFLGSLGYFLINGGIIGSDIMLSFSFPCHERPNGILEL